MDYRIRCPHCETETRFSLSLPFWTEGVQPARWFIGERGSADAGQHEMGPVVLSISADPNAQRMRLTACTSVCPECKGPVILTFLATSAALSALQNSWGAPGHISAYRGHPLQLAEILPRSRLRTEYADAPPKVAREFPAAVELAMQGRAPAMVISACGSCLEEILKSLEEKALALNWMAAPTKKGLRLVERIDALRDAGIITRDVADWGHTLRLDRNESVHELEASSERALQFVHYIQFLLEAAFALPERLRSLRGEPSAPDSSEAA